MVRLSTLSAALLFTSLSFAAQAEPQQNGPSPGSPTASQSGGSPSGANNLLNRGKTAEQTNQSGAGEDKAGQMHKSPQGAQASHHANKANKNAENENNQADEGSSGKNGEHSDAKAGGEKEKNAKAGESGKNKTGDNAKANGIQERKDAEANQEAGKNAESNNKEKNGMKDGASQGAAEAKGNFEGKEGESAKLDAEQTSKVKTYFSEHKESVHRVEKDRVSVSIGIALPTAVTLYDLPPNVIAIRGSCPIKYFAWGDDLVLVDSCSREVVDIIPDVV